MSEELHQIESWVSKLDPDPVCEHKGRMLRSRTLTSTGWGKYQVGYLVEEGRVVRQRADTVPGEVSFFYTETPVTATFFHLKGYSSQSMEAAVEKAKLARYP